MFKVGDLVVCIKGHHAYSPILSRTGLYIIFNIDVHESGWGNNYVQVCELLTLRPVTDNNDEVYWFNSSRFQHVNQQKDKNV